MFFSYIFAPQGAGTAIELPSSGRSTSKLKRLNVNDIYINTVYSLKDLHITPFLTKLHILPHAQQIN